MAGARRAGHPSPQRAADPRRAQRRQRPRCLRAGVQLRRELREARRGPAHLQGPAPPPRARGEPQRRRLVRRLQGHQRRRHRRRAVGPGQESDPDPGRGRKGTGLLAPARAREGVCQDSPSHRSGCAFDRKGCRRQAVSQPVRRRSKSKFTSKSGRSRAAVARVRELRHVPRLPAPRRSVRRRGEGAGMSKTFVFARNAPSTEYDRTLTWAALLLTAMGLVMVYSASIATAESSRFTGNNAAWYLFRHGIFLALALGAAIAVFLIPARWWQIAAPWLFLVALVLLVLVLVPGFGREVNGARRWLNLPVISMQPSEVMKLAVVLYAADYTVRKHAVMKNF